MMMIRQKIFRRASTCCELERNRARLHKRHLGEHKYKYKHKNKGKCKYKLKVRPEEAGILLVVLGIWIGAILLFYSRSSTIKINYRLGGYLPVPFKNQILGKKGLQINKVVLDGLLHLLPSFSFYQKHT